MGQNLFGKILVDQEFQVQPRNSEARESTTNYHDVKFVCDISILLLLQIEKSQGEIYRLRAKLESTQTENENMADELEKMQRALNQSYADRDRIGSDLDKIRDDLERSQVNILLQI